MCETYLRQSHDVLRSRVIMITTALARHCSLNCHHLPERALAVGDNPAHTHLDSAVYFLWLGLQSPTLIVGFGWANLFKAKPSSPSPKSQAFNTGALIIKIRFWGPLTKEPPPPQII